MSLTGRLTLGREPGSRGLKLNDDAVSRKHVHITWHQQHGLAELEDLKSKNGTFVNGLRTARRYLEIGDVVRIGDTLMLVREGGEAGDAHDPVPGMVGRSAAMMAAKARLAMAARGGLPVLILGETGSGKELAARAVHELSERGGEFEPMNCSAVPEQLFESVFFGHRRGAFTGATDDSKGILRQCDKGTVFLDEIGELPPAAQPKLLRFLEDGMIRPVGETRQKKVDVRVVAATNAELPRLEAEGKFRADLLARLETIVVHLPSLAERKEDVLPLLRHFSAAAGFEHVEIEPDAAEALLVAPWKRNVRGLKALVDERAQMAWPGEVRNDGAVSLAVEDLPRELGQPVLERSTAPVPPVIARQTRPSKEELARMLEQHGRNINLVALAYGKDRKQIYRWMEFHGIER